MLKLNKKLFFISFLFFLCSCTNNRLVRDVGKFMNQQITLPESMSVVWRGKDTIMTNYSTSFIKLIIWYDSLRCISCEANKINEWREIIAYTDSLDKWLSIIYLFTPRKNDIYKVKMALKSDKLDYPIFIDQHLIFVKQNPKLPKNRELHSFLLDKDNRVVLIGNPLHAPPVWNLYKKTIQTLIDNDGVLPKGYR